MFTGFASENTPAIQVWDFFRTFASTSAVRSVSLPDDCAPIQIFRTGATATEIADIIIPLNISLPAGYRIYATFGTVVAAGFHLTAVGGDY